MTFLAAFAISFLLIFLKATQQRQVQFAQYWRMPPISMGMAFCEVFIVSKVSRSGDNMELVFLAICIGIGAGIGSVLGTYLHARRMR